MTPSKHLVNQKTRPKTADMDLCPMDYLLTQLTSQRIGPKWGLAYMDAMSLALHTVISNAK